MPAPPRAIRMPRAARRRGCSGPRRRRDATPPPCGRLGSIPRGDRRSAARYPASTPRRLRAARLYRAPLAHDRAEELHRLLDARDRAPLVGLVRELRLAGPEDHRGRAAEAALQVGAVGGEGDGLRRRALAEERRADLEYFLHPLIRGLGVERRRVDDLAHA